MVSCRECWGGGYIKKLKSAVLFLIGCVCVCLCLHSYFSDNQYPDEAKREEIATACNAVIQKPGR